MKYGYMRISTNEEKQSFERQEQQLKDAGCEIIYKDMESGTKENRKGLNELLSILQEGDCVVTVEFSRISRSLQQLISIADDLNSRGVDFMSLHESIDTSTPEGKLFYSIIGAFAEFEVNLIRSRTNQGLQAARNKGRVGGRPRIPQKNLNSAINLWLANELSISEICETTKVSKSALYREIKEKNLTR